MKWLFTSLVLMNVILYVWVTDHPVQSNVTFPDAMPNVNERAMELLHERNARRGRPVLTNCLRVGPFATDETYSRASRLLVNRGYGFTRNVISARELRTFRVYLGPFDSPIEQDQFARKLDQIGLNFYVHQDEAGTLLSIQMFSQGGEAGRYVAELTALGLAPKAKAEVRTLGPLRWLEISDVVNEERRQNLAALDWADRAVRLAAVPCGTNS
tara:strand:+ start:44 stop:682 length:639 start_codon:yes stop_codon:yes gene_type:complete